jgi:hypothetical protein
MRRSLPLAARDPLPLRGRVRVGAGLPALFADFALTPALSQGETES